MRIRTTPWGYAWEEWPEVWNHADSREQAIEALGNQGGFITMGEWADPRFHVLDFDHFCDEMVQSARDNGIPDGYDEPFEYKDQAELAYDTFMDWWSRKYVKSTYWVEVGKPEKIDGKAPVVRGDDLRVDGRCATRCDHDSQCTLPVGHAPKDRHETEHGCICFDPRDKALAAVRALEEP